MLLPPLVPLIDNNTTEVSAHKGDNPLIWPLLSLLQKSVQGWKVHHLASELQSQGLMHDLDPAPEKDLFKRNFLLMNALFELQDMLLPNQWVQTQAMDIRILRLIPSDIDLIQHQEAGLKSYYLDWGNYDTSTNVVREMLESFWTSYKDYIGINGRVMHLTQALRVFELDASASDRDIRRQWRKLALKWHPDRQGGDAARFREVCEAWQALRVRESA
ncbi:MULTISPECIES: DNA-J related domain-containing protein [Shewanella]|uniref:DNA-J related domain-containing protein n=1 Tax=Shewanella TaxID=22 RepID=UPI001C65D5F6|nr:MULTISPECIES: DNA-J related domain-containing protein [Shewanella]QYJ74697.1 DnaJ domain-containing protein [Shewanella sp. FJAT-52076]QYK04562.1 DnaJ domain-containing protein [Shewanella zhangzhouensis]